MWSEGEDRITILDRRNPKELAAELALQLLRIHGAPSKRKGREEISAILPPTTRRRLEMSPPGSQVRDGVWCKLAAILYGDRKADLFRYVRKIAGKHRHEIGYLLTQKTATRYLKAIALSCPANAGHAPCLTTISTVSSPVSINLRDASAVSKPASGIMVATMDRSIPPMIAA